MGTIPSQRTPKSTTWKGKTPNLAVRPPTIWSFSSSSTLFFEVSAWMTKEIKCLHLHRDSALNIFSPWPWRSYWWNQMWKIIHTVTVQPSTYLTAVPWKYSSLEGSWARTRKVFTVGSGRKWPCGTYVANNHTARKILKTIQANKSLMEVNLTDHVASPCFAILFLLLLGMKMHLCYYHDHETGHHRWAIRSWENWRNSQLLSPAALEKNQSYFSCRTLGLVVYIILIFQ